ncbi:MAG: 2-amino-4-hydroxy-6-hydroxymethyldihydropteridine diphosphokinase, partial [Dysgonamonadaceae bacterium]|nr:2-amino-4-hydroxy-6-hydroxymethyldihydropteridine diphosphokinase [Dysgonamonadaceae bacterium]
SENMFLNMVICIETRLTPQQILEATQKIEKEIGRKNKSLSGYSDRIIDIDLILCDNLIIDTKELTIPHPRFHERFFVLEPLNEIAPDLIHPTMGKTVRELLFELCSSLR